MPSIQFFLANTDHPMDSHHPLWQRQLPERKDSVALAADHQSRSMTYGDYFSAIADFCASNAWHPILSAMQQSLQRPITIQEILQLSVFLEKHGALYHPGRVMVTTPDQAISFVVNVAASDAGRNTLPLEMDALARLGDQRPFGWFPTLYSGVLEPTPMFLANWFDGYHEFHLTRSKKKADLSTIVWDGAQTPHLLTDQQSADLYRQASMILTACYDPLTTDQIYPWHHAAGDFVVREKGPSVDVKLITVRNYAPVPTLTTVPKNERALLDNLVAFCLHLSIGMRLDRLDGVLETALGTGNVPDTGDRWIFQRARPDQPVKRLSRYTPIPVSGLLLPPIRRAADRNGAALAGIPFRGKKGRTSHHRSTLGATFASDPPLHSKPNDR